MRAEHGKRQAVAGAPAEADAWAGAGPMVVAWAERHRRLSLSPSCWGRAAVPSLSRRVARAFQKKRSGASGGGSKNDDDTMSARARHAPARHAARWAPCILARVLAWRRDWLKAD